MIVDNLKRRNKQAALFTPQCSNDINLGGFKCWQETRTWNKKLELGNCSDIHKGCPNNFPAIHPHLIRGWGISPN